MILFSVTMKVIFIPFIPFIPFIKMNTLPSKVQNIFQTQISQLRKYDIVKKIHDKDNDTTYFIHEFKDDPEASYLE